MGNRIEKCCCTDDDFDTPFEQYERASRKYSVNTYKSEMTTYSMNEMQDHNWQPAPEKSVKTMITTMQR